MILVWASTHFMNEIALGWVLGNMICYCHSNITCVYTLASYPAFCRSTEKRGEPGIFSHMR